MNLVWIYWPGGCWKTTLQRTILNYRPDTFVRIVLDTDRPPRKDIHWNSLELEGRDYHFISPEEFARRKYVFSIQHGERNYGVSCTSKAIQEISLSIWTKIGIIVWWRRLIEKIKSEWKFNLLLIQMLVWIDTVRSSMLKRWDNFHDVLERLRDFYSQQAWLDGSLKVTREYSVEEITDIILWHYSLWA